MRTAHRGDRPRSMAIVEMLGRVLTTNTTVAEIGIRPRPWSNPTCQVDQVPTASMAASVSDCSVVPRSIVARK